MLHPISVCFMIVLSACSALDTAAAAERPDLLPPGAYLGWGRRSPTKSNYTGKGVDNFPLKFGLIGMGD